MHIYRLDDNQAPESYTFKYKIKIGIFEKLFIDFNVLAL